MLGYFQLVSQDIHVEPNKKIALSLIVPVTDSKYIYIMVVVKIIYDYSNQNFGLKCIIILKY